jgi:alpha-tubulin suppressor-like RCC1 family protein
VIARFSLIWPLLGLLGCSEAATGELGEQRAPIIFGADGRREVYAFAPGSLEVRLASASAAVVPASALRTSADGAVELSAPSLRSRVGLCADEPFGDEPTAAVCSATLIAPDLLLTAGHCVTADGCAATRFVFDYAMSSVSELAPLLPRNIYSCADVVVHRFDERNDYSIVRLDRSVEGRAPVTVRADARPLNAAASLIAVGHPTGLPQKISLAASVNDPRAASMDYFTAHIDSFPGNSGSGVFLEKTGELAGMLVRGPASPPYVRYDGERCTRPERLPDDSSEQVESVYLRSAVHEFCSVASDPRLCACGNASCEATLGETTATCPEDCGSACGDAACNGVETGDSCYADCGSCGNAVCEESEVTALGCCQDCGCPTGFSCEQRSCEPRLGNLNGDSKVDAADVAAFRANYSEWRRAGDHPKAADVDCDGSVTETDLLALSRVGAGADPKVPCETVTSVAVGYSHTCIASGAGSVRCFGEDRFGQLGDGLLASQPASAQEAKPIALGDKVAQVVAGQFHTCALTTSGRVKCWGLGAFGQLGYGNTDDVGDDEAPERAGWVQLGDRATSLAAGDLFTCAVLADGKVRCWGENAWGQLGYGHTNTVGDDEVPAAETALDFGVPVRQLATGSAHACALLANGAVQCWGLNFLGQLGLGHSDQVGDDEPATATPSVTLGGEARAVAAGIDHTCALLSDGALRCWGDNSWGQLGTPDPMPIGDDELPISVPPVAVSDGLRSMALGAGRTCLLDDAGDVRCWGKNLAGELGLGHTDQLPSPVEVTSLERLALGDAAVSIHTRADHSCALLRSGNLRCWGNNEYGQLGHADKENIGDDESVASAGDVPLTGANDTGWYFANPLGLEVWAMDESSDLKSSSVAVYVRNAGARPVAGFSLLYQFSTAEQPAREVALQDHYTPWSSVNLEGEAPLRWLRFDFGTQSLAPGQSSSWGSNGGEKTRIHFRDWSPTWRWDNDYSAADRGPRGRWYPTERLQVVGRDGRLLRGWKRPSTLAIASGVE